MTTIRASSLSELFDCPARWQAKHLKGMRLPASGASRLGTAVHAGTAAFDAARISGSPITADDAAGPLVDAIHRPDEDVAWDDDLTPSSAERIALALHGLYCAKIAPDQAYVGVEVPCERLEITDLGIVLAGTTDRVRRTRDGYGVVDLKTGSTAVGADGKAKTAGHAMQLGVYELLASEAMGLSITAPAQVVGLQTAKTARGQRVGTGEISGARYALLGDQDAPGLLEMAADMLRAGRFHGNPRSQLCSTKYCPAYGGCRFRA